MPKDTSIKKVLIIGSGPIIIGQACEFDYSGTQACKALKSLGYEVVLVNSNPATIMTDPGIADQTYIEPLNVARLEEIISIERPDALLPNLGGQSGLNLCSELYEQGILDRYDVRVIGVKVDAIQRGEDRIEFKNAMNSIGIDMPRSEPAYSVEEAEAIADQLGYPVVIRPAYTMGGTGGGIVKDVDELRSVSSRGIAASMVGQILVEECLIGWEELELEVVRDATGRMITVCFIENIDPLGVHTGDSFCAAPMLTISKELQERLQRYAYAIVESIGVVGGTNVQFAHDPVSDRVVIIEINPRTSRSSALASKATGFPIAYVSALLAAGLTLSELPYYAGRSLADYTPKGDYVVVKFSRWAFEKFRGSIDKLGTQMRAVGEVMSIGKTYKEAFHKAIRSLENGRYGLGYAKNFGELTAEELIEKLSDPTSERQFIMYEALRKGVSVEKLWELTKIKRWFIEQMKELVDEEQELLKYRGTLPPADLFEKVKLDGFADRYIAKLLGLHDSQVFDYRDSLGICKKFEGVPVSGVPAGSYYYYSTYHKIDPALSLDSTLSDSGKKKVMVLGGGPNRIGQGIEFDYCCVHAVNALKAMGYETVMVNCNPETVSTDYDTADRLFFEPLTVEDVLAIYKYEAPLGVIVSFGGQTPLNIATRLKELGVRILGTPPEVIDTAEDRDLFRQMMEKLEIPMPESGMAVTVDEALAISKQIGYPLMVRPSFVLGGRGMEVVHNDAMLRTYMEAAVGVTPERPILIDRFLSNATECEADAISDGVSAFVPAVMQHIELAGIHSGDSACVIPSTDIPAELLKTIYDYTERIACELGVCGVMNIQYAIENGKVYVIEANPRASRTVPLVSKVTGFSMIPAATKVMMAEFTGEKLDFSTLKREEKSYFGVKEAVFPFNMFQEVDPILGPEMRSTGEVLGIAETFGLAYARAQEATQTPLPLSGCVLMSVSDNDKPAAVDIAKTLISCGFSIKTTIGTGKYLREHGIEPEIVPAYGDYNDAMIEEITSGRVDILIDTPSGKSGKSHGAQMRRAAIKSKIPYITTIVAAAAAAVGIKECIQYPDKAKAVCSLQKYHGIK